MCTAVGYLGKDLKTSPTVTFCLVFDKLIFDIDQLWGYLKLTLVCKRLVYVHELRRYLELFCAYCQYTLWSRLQAFPVYLESVNTEITTALFRMTLDDVYMIWIWWFCKVWSKYRCTFECDSGFSGDVESIYSNDCPLIQAVCISYWWSDQYKD